MSLLFQGEAWLLQERKTTFYAPRYSQAPLLIRREVLPFWSHPQAVLQLGEHGDFLVQNAEVGDAAKLSGDPKESKKLLRITVRAMDDVRRAQMYQTAARTQTLELFVDVEHTRDRLLRCLRAPSEAMKRDQAGKRLLDEAFAALERAQQSSDRNAALKLYKEAERGFYEAEQVVDERSRELLKARRADLQRTIRGLESEARTEIGSENGAQEAPVQVVTAPVPMDISARLEELRRFAAQQESERAQQEQQKGTDLAARLAVLKNEKAGPAAPTDDLAERLRRLRGDDAPAAAANEGAKSAVDRIIEQVTDEIALGIEEDEMDEEVDDSDLDSSDSSSAPSSESSEAKSKRSSGQAQH